MSAHTPGPWVPHVRVTGKNRGGRQWTVGAEREAGRASPVCLIYGTWPVQRAEADARLIAAAPDLLDALKGMLASLMPDECSGPRYERACAAIAKAEGKP